MTTWNSDYTYFITYSCYTRKMSVLLNGKDTLSRNSAVLQYMNEPFTAGAASCRSCFTGSWGRITESSTPDGRRRRRF